uniref:Uncharacterized protein n=1 Tax=Pseudictyota dubia TaxID=2749911 RepID=A0A7R9VCW2_9STRA
MVIVLVTVFLLGGTTEIALSALDIDVDIDEEEYMKSESERLNFGFLNKLEDKYICPYVIRDYSRSCQSDSATLSCRLAAEGQSLGTPPVTSHGSGIMPSSDSPATQGQEMTELAHFSVMRRMGYLSDESFRRKKSLYDYGSR